MVRTSSFFVVASLVVTGLSVSNESPTADADLNAIALQVKTFADAITGIPATGGSLVQGLEICFDASALEELFTKGLVDEQTFDLSGTSHVFERTLKETLITFTNALNSLVEKKPVLQTLSPTGDITTCIKEELVELNTTTTNYLGALINTFPSNKKLGFNSFKNMIVGAFAQAITAYS